MVVCVHCMREKVLHSLFVSVEWRVIAFVITNIFFWVTTGSFWAAAGLALVLQAILFFVHTLWFFLRHELGISFLQAQHPIEEKQ